MRFILFSILLSLTFTASADNSKLSQKQFKKDISTIKANLKANKELEKSETTLRNYLADTTYYKYKNLHLMLIECLRKQYEAGNEKMYLKEKLSLNDNIDTATIVRTNVKLFIAAEAFDSLDTYINGRDTIASSYRKKHAELLRPFWGNLLQGGIYFYAHSNWQDAWLCFDTYLDCYRQPLFQHEDLDTTQYSFASFLATMAAYKLSNLDYMKEHATEAITYLPRKEMTLQKLADLCAAKGDTLNYIECLDKGNNDFPYSGYFFPNLIDYYTKHNNYDKALEIADNAMQKDSLYTTFLLARHNILMMQHNYDAALKDGITLLVIDDSLAIPTYNVACIYYQKAQNAMKQTGLSYKQRLKNAQVYYKQCLPYMERYRKLMPQDTKLWRPVLYEIYLNLNMGKEFDSLPAL